jgi:glucokinase
MVEGTSDGGVAVLGVDVGGTVIKSLASRRDREVVLRDRTPTLAGEGPEAVISRIADWCAGLAAKTSAATGSPPAALGLAVPGVVDEAAGVARFAANIGWHDVPLRELLSDRLGLPVALVHDVRSAGLAERVVGAGRGSRDFLLVQIGTGIAGALVLDGLPYAGAHGLGGELGHLTVDPAGAACGCGGRGCLETIASASAVARRYRQLSGCPGVSAAEVAERAAAGEAAAVQAWDEAVAALAAALAWYQGVLDPGLVVLGGGLASAGQILLGPLRDKLAASLSFQRMPDIAVSPLGEEAACHGAALAAWALVTGPAAQ